MSASGHKINYNLRTAKSVERRMLVDAVKDLLKHQDSSNFVYIGFGSLYFTDYKLFHKELHINDMISFEMVEADKERINFNKPFNCINVQIGKSTDLLPVLNWSTNKNYFIWMDYDNTLNNDMFNDCENIFLNISSGSLYLMSCNRQLKEFDTIKNFKATFGEVVPFGVLDKNLSGNDGNDLRLIRAMFLNKINQVLEDRNLTLPEQDHLIFFPLFFFSYKDGAPMLSFGGIVKRKCEDFTVEKFGLNKYDFVCTRDDPYKIDPPLLTYKEVFHLNYHLPAEEETFLSFEELNFIPLEEKKRYRTLYKYLPNYMDVTY